MASFDAGKEYVINWIKETFPCGSTCLDVGACDGKWYDMLGDWFQMDAVEVFKPYIEKNHLEEKYRNVYNTDIDDFQYGEYDLIIFGDVIEHMTVEKAQRVLAYAKHRCKNLLVSVPYKMTQGAENGNPYEVHIQDDLTDKIFRTRYPGFQMLTKPLCDYAYYIKQDKSAYVRNRRPKFSIILPTHNGRDRIGQAITSVLDQSFADFELIVICDACTDGTQEYVEYFSDERITVISADVKRDGLARNIGLDSASGDWILFIDDDDWFLHEYCLELLADKVGKNKEDVLDFSFVWKDKGYKVPSPEESFVMVWCRAWRRSFIADNRFEGCPYGSDKLFWIKMIKDNPNIRISYWNMPLYYYNFNREGSLSYMYNQTNKPLLDIIITHYDEPWEVGKPFFDMLSHQRVADMKRVNIILVQDGKEQDIPWQEYLGAYPFHVSIVTLVNHAGTAAARNAGMKKAQSEWLMFCDFDDMFGDVSALCMLMNLLPTDECDIIWGKYAMEMIWRKGLPYIQTVNIQNFINTTAKLYRKKFLQEHNITFDESLRYSYEYAFNAVCLTMTPPFRVREFVTEFYPYFKTHRKNSLKCSEEYYRNEGRILFETNIRIAEILREKRFEDEAKQFIVKALCFAFYSIHDPVSGDDPGVPDQTVYDFVQKYRDVIASASANDMTVILDEAEACMMNVVQRLYNEYKQEYYLKNDNIAFPDWLIRFDSPQPAAPTISEPIHQTDDQQRVVVYCGTSNVYPEMLTSCKSLLWNIPVDKVYFLIEDDEFPFELPDIVETINVKNQQYFPHDGPNYDNAWSYMCMMRAAFPEMFPQYSRILSLDIDIIIDDNVSDLWDYDLSGYYLAGVPEKQRQKTEDDPLYINFGVVLMNLDALRADNKQQEIINALNSRKIDCPEQTAFNDACAFRILELPPDFNSTVYSHITGRADHERILHYAGQTFWKHYTNVKRYSDKPWSEIIRKQSELKGADHNE